MSHKWCGKCSTAWWKTSHDATGKGKGNRRSADVAKKARAAANKAAQTTGTCEQVHVGAEKDDLAEMKAKLSTALEAKEALMIGRHSTDNANRLDQEILTLRRAVTDQRPLGEQLAGIQGVIARGDKRLNVSLAERESAMEALQAAETKIAQQRHEVQEHQHELETLQPKIASTSNATANTGFRRTAWA